jgi:hypothetical protein
MDTGNTVFALRRLSIPTDGSSQPNVECANYTKCACQAPNSPNSRGVNSDNWVYVQFTSSLWSVLVNLGIFAGGLRVLLLGTYAAYMSLFHWCSP